IVVVGATYEGGDAVIARYQANGSPDLTFGTDGVVTTDIAASDLPRAVTVQPDGKLVVAGYSPTATGWGGWLLRYTADGSLGASFGVGGIVKADFGGTDYLMDVVVAKDGGLIVAGTAYPNGAILARYSADGVLDSSFVAAAQPALSGNRGFESVVAIPDGF